MAEYKELGNKRLKIVQKYLDLIKNMTGSKAYDVTQEQVTEITEALHKQVDGIQSAFDGRTKTKKEFEDIIS